VSVFELREVPLDPEVQHVRRRRVRLPLPVVGRPVDGAVGQQIPLGVGRRRVDHNAVVGGAAGVGVDGEAVGSRFDTRDRRPGVNRRPLPFGDRPDAVDDGGDTALRIVDAEVVVDVAHQRVQRRRVVRRPAEEHERVLDKLTELRVIEVLLGVTVHRADEVEPEPSGRPRHRRVEVVRHVRPVGDHHLFHADLVGVFRVVEVAFERLARARLVRLEQLHRLLRVRRDRGLVAVLPEDLIVRVEPLEIVEIGGLVAEPLEEALEQLGHPDTTTGRCPN